jgi:hypothetical protein
MTDAGDEEAASLPKLLAALAMGARAVHSLPLGDEFDFQSSFPECGNLAADTRERLVDVLALVEPSLRGRDATDPQVWEICADTCDALLEQAEVQIAAPAMLEEVSQKARQQAQGSYNRMMQGLVDM